MAAEGAILNEMLEIVAKRAALRPSDITGHTSLQSETVSLPVLPPQTTINPLLQHQIYNSNNENQPRYPNSNAQHTFSSQSHNQEHEVSLNKFDGIESFYLRSNFSILHDCELLLNTYKHQVIFQRRLTNNTLLLNFNRQTILVIFEFLLLYIGIIIFSYYMSIN